MTRACAGWAGRPWVRQTAKLMAPSGLRSTLVELVGVLRNDAVRSAATPVLLAARYAAVGEVANAREPFAYREALLELVRARPHSRHGSGRQRCQFRASPESCPDRRSGVGASDHPARA